jgi:hypothetical protein
MNGTTAQIPVECCANCKHGKTCGYSPLAPYSGSVRGVMGLANTHCLAKDILRQSYFEPADVASGVYRGLN